MQAHIGESFTGTVSGVTRFGLFVMLPFGVEGLVPADALPDGEYLFDEGRMTLTGTPGGSVFSFGMPLEVVCAAADPGSGEITFGMKDSETGLPRQKTERPAFPRQPKQGRRNHAPVRKRRRR